MIDKYSFKKRYQNRTRLRGVAVILVMMLLSGGIIFFKPLLFSYYAKLTTWMVERQSHLVKKAANVKHTAVNEANTEPQIHFEFYTALPNMKEMKMPVSKVEIANANELENELSAAAKEER